MNWKFWQTTTPVNDDFRVIELGMVTADATRCIQCGVCGYNCPVGIPVRDYARQGLPVTDNSCITCGQCIAVCPRGTLRWEKEVSSHQ
jgi:ferredoxin